MPEFTTKMKEYRSKKNIKQGELAEMVGVRRETIIRLEKGQYNPSLKLALDVAKALDTTVEELFIFNKGNEIRTLLARTSEHLGVLTVLNATKKPHLKVWFFCWRREEDSNLRYVSGVHTISNRAP